MHPQEPRDRDENDDRVMTGDGAVRRDGPKPTMTADGAVVGDESPDELVMTGDGVEPRVGRRPEMTADGVAVQRSGDGEPEPRP